MFRSVHRYHWPYLVGWNLVYSVDIASYQAGTDTTETAAQKNDGTKYVGVISQYAVLL